MAAMVAVAGWFVLSCQKPAGPDKQEPDPDPVYTYPTLPGDPYDYVSVYNNMPAYIADYLRSNPDIDNTPVNNPITNTGAALGRVLFYDKLLSVNNTVACASCHHQNKAFTDGEIFSKGFDGGLTKRNAMSTVNLRFFKAKKMFWDMRAADLEAQTLMPITDHIEMGMASLTALEKKLQKAPYYPALFMAAYGTADITSDKIARALSQFLRAVISFNSKYDKGLSNNFAEFTTAELNGKAMVTRAFCTECHSDLKHVGARQEPSFLIVENSGINTGFGSNNGLDAVFTDNGIGAITQLAKDMGTFKMPTLRNIELTAPYMHDGRFATLEQVIDHYSTGIKQNPNLGRQLRIGGFQFTDQQKSDIIAFLKTLTDQSLATEPKFADPFK
jgi:cytochrome c peroxidase